MGVFQNITDLIKLGGHHKRQNNPFERELPVLTIEDKENIVNFFARWEIPNEGFEYDPTIIDDMFIVASRYVVRGQSGSVSILQDKLNLTYQFAGYLIDQLESHGIVGQYFGGGDREVLITSEENLNMYLFELYENDRDEFGKIALGHEYFASPQIIDFIEEHRQVIKERREEYLREKENEKQEIEKKEIKRKIREKERKKQLEREAVTELIEDGMVFNNGSGKVNREPIPQDVMDKVWNRDEGKCVKCGSAERLEFDHIIPISKGGANTYRNIQLLCENCNRKKSNKIG